MNLSPASERTEHGRGAVLIPTTFLSPATSSAWWRSPGQGRASGFSDPLKSFCSLHMSAPEWPRWATIDISAWIPGRRQQQGLSRRPPVGLRGSTVRSTSSSGPMIGRTSSITARCVTWAVVEYRYQVHHRRGWSARRDSRNGRDLEDLQAVEERAIGAADVHPLSDGQTSRELDGHLGAGSRANPPRRWHPGRWRCHGSPDRSVGHGTKPAAS
jgi:hypothetical protein